MVIDDHRLSSRHRDVDDIHPDRFDSLFTGVVPDSDDLTNMTRRVPDLSGRHQKLPLSLTDNARDDQRGHRIPEQCPPSRYVRHITWYCHHSPRYSNLCDEAMK